LINSYFGVTSLKNFLWFKNPCHFDFVFQQILFLIF
jgi:hypothetical protein